MGYNTVQEQCRSHFHSDVPSQDYQLEIEGLWQLLCPLPPGRRLRAIGTQNPISPFMSWTALGKLRDLSPPQCFHLLNGHRNMFYLKTGCCENYMK